MRYYSLNEAKCPWGYRAMRMKPLMMLLALGLPIVAFFAFAFATIRRESEVAMHIFTDEGFLRARIIFITLGGCATVLELFVLSRLLRRRSHREKSNSA
jgi:hypothetical protein